jgi:Tol biopolymer transport system component
MGEVFRARDPRLNREVALKVLPETLAGDETRRARFTQEARAAGALSHPGIVAVYDIGTADGAFYMVTELVEGETLRVFLSEGKLAQRKAIDLAAQVAEAMAAAHAGGITHRDLKPENIMVARDGRAKILDFGLARQAAGAASVDAPTQTQALTREGTVMGTMGYMSPEQLRGKPVDARSDIFSFGVVLYEMLAGLRAFDRETSVDMVSAILKEDPADLPAAIPAGLAQIVHRCLEKEPARRFQSAADLAFALRSLNSGTTAIAAASVATARVRPPVRSWIPYAVAALGVAAGLAGWLVHPRAAAPLYEIVPLTSFRGEEVHPALSPDGRQLAFVWSGEPAQQPGVYVKQIGGGTQPLRISPAGKPAAYPCWSPDGIRVAYVRAEGNETSIVVTPSIGGPERRVARLGGSLTSPIAWSPDGKWIAATVPEKDGSSSSLHLVSLDTGEPHRVTTAPARARDAGPKFSPDGKVLAFVRVASVFSNPLYWVGIGSDGNAEGGPRQIGLKSWYTQSLDWFPDSRSIVVPVVYGARQQHWRLTVPGGVATRLALEFSNDLGSFEPAGIALRGERLAVLWNTTRWSVGRLAWNQGSRRFENAEFYGSSRSDDTLQVSPNGEWVVFCSTRSGTRELWRANRDGSGALPLTSSGEVRVGSPRWSPDNRSVAFDGGHEGRIDIFVVSAEGGRMRQLTRGTKPSFSWDGKWIYFAGQGRIWKIPVEGGQPQALTDQGVEAFESRDGRWLYYLVRGAAGGVFRIPANATEPAKEGQLFAREPSLAAWALAGNRLYLGLQPRVEAARVVRVDIDSGTKEEVYRYAPNLRPFVLAGTSLAVCADEQTMYFSSVGDPESDIVMVDHFR